MNLSPCFIISRFTLLLCVALTNTHAQSPSPQPNSNRALASTLDELLEVVKRNAIADTEENRRRIKEFTQERDTQQKLLQQENTAIAQQDELSNQLNATINENDRALTELEGQLSKRLGNFGELFGVTRQVAGDTRAQIENSIISAQFPTRQQALEQIATSKELPTIEQLRSLWVTLLQEQTEQGKVARFHTAINTDSGTPQQESEVIRFGPFTAISGGKFLSYNEETQEFSVLPKQPGSNFTRSAQRLLDAQPQSIVTAAIDPSRGTILGLLVQTPGIGEWFTHGGLPGYVVTVLAIIGLTIGLQRLISLWVVSMKVQKQMRTEEASPGNPLGRVLKTYQDNPGVDVETLELKLDDAVLKEVPRFERGLNTLKVLAAVAPLMGLLGTVVGMIITFQSITLWGTGDPKLMANGISQALVTTVQGLIAAIPLLLLHSIANGRARILQQILEEQSAGLIAVRAESNHA